MLNPLFVLVLAVLFALLLWWSFKTLPGEKWQIMASVPVAKDSSGSWRGLNLTYYGFFTANAYGIAVAIMFILMGSIDIPLYNTLTVVGVLLMLCVPASKQIARIVEKKPHTFTVGGAIFVGILLAPWVIDVIGMLSLQTAPVHLPVIPTLAALSISYAFGEGFGRLACISFGCCYGKPLTLSHPVMRTIFDKFSFVFHGKTKKIAYASGMEGEKVIPVQAVTSLLYVATGLAGILLFLGSHFLSAFILPVLITQLWRACSETLRADYRGEWNITAYQMMGVAAVIYSLILTVIFPLTSTNPPDLISGLKSIWSPVPLIFIWALRLSIFYFTGRSMVTGATLSFHVIQDRI